MARRSKRSKGRRVTTDNANNYLLPFMADDTPLMDIQDRRAFNPSSPYSPNVKTDTLPARVRRKPKVYQHSLKKRLAKNQVHLVQSFFAPENVLICVRRKTRKEVLHAFKKIGMKGQKKPRRNVYSDVHC